MTQFIDIYTQFDTISNKTDKSFKKLCENYRIMDDSNISYVECFKKKCEERKKYEELKNQKENTRIIMQRYQKLQKIFKEKVKLFPELVNWRLKIHTLKNAALGETHYYRKIISVSKGSLFYDSFEVILNTLLHEIAHVLAGWGHGHDKVWKEKCKLTGAIPEKCAASELPYQWFLICGNGCYKKSYFRRNLKKYVKEGRCCGKCKNNLYYIKNKKYIKL